MEILQSSITFPNGLVKKIGKFKQRFEEINAKRRENCNAKYSLLVNNGKGKCQRKDKIKLVEDLVSFRGPFSVKSNIDC